MLFNSAVFLFLFLPAVVLVYHGLRGSGLPTLAKCWLILASLYFYAYWKLEYLPLLLFSIVANYLIGVGIGATSGQAGGLRAKALLTLGICINIGLLGYFKYFGFLREIAGSILNLSFEPFELLLPLAISFFTFQQVAYLVDCYRNEAREYQFINYCLFVSFFPQLIAGPIVHHRQMMPQFEATDRKGAVSAGDVAAGLFIFSIGLFKKVCIADSFAVVADTGYAQASLSLVEAWTTSLSYTFQLYYDFSGYSDMAIGGALLFGIRLPLNFFSPYRAASIQDFWRRWHITLSNWLRDYIFIPFGGSRGPLYRTCRNLFITFLIGGIWHGAGWTFILWGALHGGAIVLHRLWQQLERPLPYWLGWFLTFNFVNLAWVYFRAEDLDTAHGVLAAMFSTAEISINGTFIYQLLAAREGPVFAVLVSALNTSIFWVLPVMLLCTVLFRNTMELSGYRQGAMRLSYTKVLVSALAFGLAALTILSGSPSAFLYFNF
jgi:D-alanyl-lipoteichoic acid acyltransferase DltB (MBOAT superfamily)